MRRTNSSHAALAADSAQLGGNPPSAYLQGSGRAVSGRVTAAAGAGPVELLDLGFGHIDGSCAAGGPESITWQAATTEGAHIATAWTSGQFITGTGCVFIGQGLTTG